MAEVQNRVHFLTRYEMSINCFLLSCFLFQCDLLLVLLSFSPVICKVLVEQATSGTSTISISIINWLTWQYMKCKHAQLINELILIIKLITVITACHYSIAMYCTSLDIVGVYMGIYIYILWRMLHTFMYIYIYVCVLYCFVFNVQHLCSDSLNLQRFFDQVLEAAAVAPRSEALEP